MSTPTTPSTPTPSTTPTTPPPPTATGGPPAWITYAAVAVAASAVTALVVVLVGMPDTSSDETKETIKQAVAEGIEEGASEKVQESVEQSVREGVAQGINEGAQRTVEDVFDLRFLDDTIDSERAALSAGEKIILTTIQGMSEVARVGAQAAPEVLAAMEQTFGAALDSENQERALGLVEEILGAAAGRPDHGGEGGEGGVDPQPAAREALRMLGDLFESATDAMPGEGGGDRAPRGGEEGGARDGARDGARR